MSRFERYGTRDLTYSKWHRRLEDFVTCIDLDSCEYCQKCREPLVLIEIAQDVGQTFKATPVMRKLARQAKLPAYLVFYKKSNDDFTLISQFRMRQVYPIYDSQDKILSPEIYANFLRHFHLNHKCGDSNAKG